MPQTRLTSWRKAIKLTGQELWSLSQGARQGGWNTWLSLQGMICTSSPACKSSLHAQQRSDLELNIPRAPGSAGLN